MISHYKIIPSYLCWFKSNTWSFPWCWRNDHFQFSWRRPRKVLNKISFKRSYVSPWVFSSTPAKQNHQHQNKRQITHAGCTIAIKVSIYLVFIWYFVKYLIMTPQHSQARHSRNRIGCALLTEHWELVWYRIFLLKPAETKISRSAIIFSHSFRKFGKGNGQPISK